VIAAVRLGNGGCNAVAPIPDGDRAMCATDTSSARARAENWQARLTASGLASQAESESPRIGTRLDEEKKE
jgi:hypothetical protein